MSAEKQAQKVFDKLAAYQKVKAKAEAAARAEAEAKLPVKKA